MLASSAAFAQKGPPVVACGPTGDIEARIAACTAALEKSPRPPDKTRAAFHLLRGYAKGQKYDFKAALADADLAVMLDEGNYVYVGSRSTIYRALGDFGAAIADARRAIALAPKSAEMRSVLADALREKGDLVPAMDAYSAALALDASELTAYLGRSLIYRTQGRFDEAERELLRGMALSDRLARLHTAQGLLAESLGDMAKAKAAYSRAIALPVSFKFDNKPGRATIDSTRDKAVARARLSVLTTASANVPPSARDERSQRRIALVIGNGAYSNLSRLPNPPRDAALVAANLRKIGFDTVERLDLAGTEIRKEIDLFLASVPSAQLAFLFFAGHAVQISGRNYLAPVDARFSGADTSGLIDLDFVLAALDDKVRANIIVLDACRDNPLLARDDGLRPGLAAQGELGKGASSGTGMLLAYATAPGQVAFDGDGDNSPFSSALVRHMVTPGLEIQQLLTRVRSEVVASTKGQQVPWSNSSLLGEVYLVR